MSEKSVKYCHGCQAELPLNARRCPHCNRCQEYGFEFVFNRWIRSIFPRHMPASRALFWGIIIYFVVISIDIIMHPDFGLKEALISPPGDLIYRWGAHLRGETIWWRLITANFVHFGLLHILFNAYAMRYVSPYVERAYGSALTIASFVILGTGSMLCSNLLGGTGLVAGASGSLMAFIGLATVSSHREKTALSIQVRNSMLKWAAFTFVFGFIASWSGAMGVDNIAHISGFLLGGLAGFLLPNQSTTGFTHLWMIRVSRIALFVSVLVTVGAFAHMGSASESNKYQHECITNIKLRMYDKAEELCGKAYDADKSQQISYHNYILVKLIKGKQNEAKSLCEEGRERFRHEKEMSFEQLCRSVGK